MAGTAQASSYDVLIVGGGHAGAQAAIALRQAKFDGSVAIVSDEPDLPYERPALSKDYLAGEKPFERIMIRPAKFWAERDVAMRLNQRVTAVHADRREVETANGERVGYRHLIWAAGGAPRRLNCVGGDLGNVHAIRNRTDVDRLLGDLSTAERVVVIGGGYIGLEAAAALTKLGKHVIVLEAQSRVLARVAGEPLSRFFEAEHRSHGVEVLLATSVDRVEGADGRAVGVRLADGTSLPADTVIVGIGIVPAVEPLLAAGAEGSGGVAVDQFCRTTLPDVYSVGDCAEHINRFANGATIRLESVQNANDMAATAARAITGNPQPYDAVPWFWSNQYDLRLQTVGLSAGHDHAVVRGAMGDRSFSVIYYRNGHVIALDCVNATKDYVGGRKLVEQASTIDAAILRDPSRSIAEILIDSQGTSSLDQQR